MTNEDVQDIGLRLFRTVGGLAEALRQTRPWPLPHAHTTEPEWVAWVSRFERTWLCTLKLTLDPFVFLVNMPNPTPLDKMRIEAMNRCIEADREDWETLGAAYTEHAVPFIQALEKTLLTRTLYKKWERAYVALDDFPSVNRVYCERMEKSTEEMSALCLDAARNIAAKARGQPALILVRMVLRLLVTNLFKLPSIRHRTLAELDNILLPAAATGGPDPKRIKL